MAYMDFLDLEKDMEQYNGPVLPLTFHLSGDGYFNSPFSLNRRDCLIKSLLHKFDDSYIENLNSYLESLSFFEFLNISTSKFWGLINFLHLNNNGVLKEKSIKAELAILEYLNKGNKTVKIHKSSQIDSINECSQAYIFNFEFINQFPESVKNIVDYCRFELYKGKKDIKLALIFSRDDQSTMSTRENHPEIQAITQRSGFMNTNSYLQTKYNKSSIRHTKASIPYFYESGEDDNKSSDDTDEQHNLGGYIGSLKPNWDEPLIMKHNDDMAYDNMDKRSFSATGSVYSNASYAPNKIEVESYNDEDDMTNFMVEEHPLLAFKNRRHGRDCCFRFQMFFLSFYKLTLLRNILPPKYPVLNLSAMVILLFFDTAASLMLFLLYEHERTFQLALIPFVFVYPFTVILAPITALLSIFICKASFYRLFLNVNALTCTTNIFLTFIFEFVFLFIVNDHHRGQIRSTDSIEPMILCLSKMAFKILLGYFACKQLAFNSNNSFHENRDVLLSIHKKVLDEMTDLGENKSIDQHTNEESRVFKNDDSDDDKSSFYN